MNQSERTPSNVPSYASLTIRRRRNNRRVRHGIRIDTIRGKHVEILIHIEYITLSHYALNKQGTTDKKWKKATSVLNEGVLKLQAQGEDVKSFWRSVETEKIEAEKRLLEMEVELAETQFSVDRTLTGNEAHRIFDRKKLNYALNSNITEKNIGKRLADDDGTEDTSINVDKGIKSRIPAHDDESDESDNENDSKLKTKIELTEFDKTYLKMNDSDKWILSTGKIVEDALYNFDPNDKIYTNEEVFTEIELDEIRKYKLKPIPQMPQDLLTYLNSFRVTEDLGMLMDWKPQGQSNRTGSAIVKMKRKIMGRCNNGTKLLHERGIKAPKMMKDMFYSLCEAVGMEEKKIRKLQSIGFIHSGLMMLLLRLDSPASYTCRITRTQMLEIPSQIIQFGSKVLPIIVLAWKAKMIVKGTIEFGIFGG
ncbi:12683_t:CDS:10 [Rhizophagus irregularis]|nr:12683_t:CDS:10 [Rhizophagus irregularis]